ncbi:HAMP domain-containing sensor histidine kinase [Paenibacillus sp. FSL H7-0350]|uniref:sensor histidine kinase n=1 Tax=Paenibacillus sp. FSL H7-0350 TaxID=2975345 RepID=UPI0031599286
MKANLHLIFRLIAYLMISLLLLALITSAVLAIVTELVIPQEGSGQDLIVLLSVPCIVFCFMVIVGWRLGKPLYYMIRRIDLLAGGIYVDPEGDKKIHSGAMGKLKRPYRLFKELILQLNTLSCVLENSKQERTRLEELRKEWVAGISHDLKTPLTYIKGYSSMMLSPEYEWTKEEEMKFLMEIEQKANHMQELISDLNLSFRLDDQQTPLQQEVTDLVEYVRRIVSDITNDPRAERYNLTLETVEGYIELKLDQRLLGRALRNLILNAILHNPQGTNITVYIMQQDQQLSVVIADDGVGMTGESIQRLFDKYYRGTSTDVLSEGTAWVWR